MSERPYIVWSGRLLSPEDADLREQHWSFHASGYVSRMNGRKNVSLHRVILSRKIGRGIETGKECGHKNQDRYDNRRENLHEITHVENLHNTRKPRTNTSGYKGVSFHKYVNKWRASISCNARQIHIGYFVTAEEAARAYDRVATIMFRGQSCINFPPTPNESDGRGCSKQTLVGGKVYDRYRTNRPSNKV